MRAVILEGFGGTENLRYVTDFPDPVPSEDEVLVRVKAVALNHLDIWIRKGALAVKPELPHIIGSDVSGVVERVGTAVRKFKEGDEVIVAPGLSCGVCESCLGGEQNLCRDYDILGLKTRGGYAEFVRIPERNLIKKPTNLSFEEAASYPLTFLTAWNALVRKGGIKPGDRVLIWAGSSGVGVAGIQIAKAFSCFVITTAGDPEKAKRCRDLGADVVIDHYREDVVGKVRELFREGIDLAVDHVGSATFEKSIHCLRKGGKVVFFGTTTGSEAKIDLRYIFVREIKLIGVYMGPNSDLHRITRLFEEGLFKPVIDRVFPLKFAGEAHSYLEESKHFGKVILLPE
jgi:NADPH:quinone reductase-like Zn-dependent oxidoreductase